MAASDQSHPEAITKNELEAQLGGPFSIVQDPKKGTIFIVVSRPLQKDGSIQLGKDADGNLQLSRKWIEKLLSLITEADPRYPLIKSHFEAGTLIAGVAFVDTTTAQLKMVRIAIPTSD